MTTTTIREILGNRPLYAATPDTSLAEAARQMAGAHVGALAVIDGTKLVGILSERDIVYRAVAQGLPVDSTPASAVMTRDPVTVALDDAVSDTLVAHLGDTFRHLPVLDGDRVAGLLSYRDIPAEYMMLFERFREMKAARADDGAR